jgi:hypothetical protein
MSWLAAAAQYKELVSATDQGVENALEEIGVTLHGIIVKMLSQPGSGRIYVRSSPSAREHQASAPGEPPAVDYGIYRASWNWVTTTGDSGDGDSQWTPGGGDFAVEVGTDQERGPALEFGGSPSNIEPRPHLRPAVEEVKGQIREITAKHIRDEQAAALVASAVIGGLDIKVNM